jgi:transposase InsO family protein
VGFTDRDWGDTRRPRRHRRFTLPDEPEPVPWVGRQRVAAALATDAVVVDGAKRALADHLDRHCRANGYAVDPETVHWDSWSVSPDGAMDIELRVMLVPRTDGEWPSIRQALAEDEADRAAAADAADTVDDRLDALRETVGVWTAKDPPEVREALEAIHARRSDPFQLDRPPS